MSAKRRSDAYFEKLYELVFPHSLKNYILVCRLLFETPFEYSVFMDKNRYEDGLSYRHRLGYDDLDMPCTVFEMMVALAVRMEEDMLSDPRYGSRISQWFWHMMISLGLNRYDDKHYNEASCRRIICTFLDRQYKENGKGGLFTFRKPTIKDPRDVEIWDAMNWWVSDNY